MLTESDLQFRYNLGAEDSNFIYFHFCEEHSYETGTAWRQP